MSNESKLIYVRDYATAYVNDVPAKKVYRKDLRTGEKFTDFSADDITWLIDAHYESEKMRNAMQSEIDSLRAENERLNRVNDGLDCLIATMKHDGHDHLTLDYLLKVTGKSAT